jgi:hypothetical protein
MARRAVSFRIAEWINHALVSSILIRGGDVAGVAELAKIAKGVLDVPVTLGIHGVFALDFVAVLAG